MPGVTVFKPAGVRARGRARVTLHFDELEALRLTSLEGLDQAEAAERMGVSRPTVGRILKRATGKVTSALVYGNALWIERGTAPVKHVRDGAEAAVPGDE